MLFCAFRMFIVRDNKIRYISQQAAEDYSYAVRTKSTRRDYECHIAADC